MNIKHSWVFKTGVLSMLGMVLMGARYGHTGRLNQQQALLFSKSQLYNISNSIGLICCSLIASQKLIFRVSVSCFLISQISFVLPLYISSTQGQNKYLSKLMPIGGLSMLIAWLSLLFC